MIQKYTKHFINLLGCILIASQSASAITIDEFEGNALLNSDTTFVSQSTVTASSSAIGGTRSLYVNKTAGPGSVILLTSGGVLSHNQGTSEAGVSIISWDGDTTPDAGIPSNFTGLGGLDFTEDNDGASKPADSFVLKLAADLGFNQPITFKIYVYSSSVSSSLVSYTINTDLPLTDLVIPFANFSQSPLPGIQIPADFSNVGAIVLEINGVNPANDIDIQSFKTNGECDTFPVNGTIYGPCNTCINLNDTTCYDCNDVPFGPAVPGTECKVPDPKACVNATFDLNCNCTGEKLFDLCNVCDGDNSTCEDCAGTPNGSAKVDQCGICGGDGTSCTDCKGDVFGTATVDECGVCGGNGTSCIQCDLSNITDILFRLDGGAKEHEKLILAMIRQILKADKSKSTAKYTKEIAATTHVLQLRNWVISWTIPQIINKCPKTKLCFEKSNVDLLKEYRGHSEELLNIGKALVKRLNKLKVPSKKYSKRNQEIHNKNVELSKTVPETTSVCA